MFHSIDFSHVAPTVKLENIKTRFNEKNPTLVAGNELKVAKPKKKRV